jgi:hypothetical protein
VAPGIAGGPGNCGWPRELWVAPGIVGGPGNCGWPRESWVAPGIAGGPRNNTGSLVRLGFPLVHLLCVSTVLPKWSSLVPLGCGLL